MLWIVAGLGLLAGDAAPPASATPTESVQFDRVLDHVYGQIAQVYLHPVRRTDVVSGALSGLYEAARAPVPGVLAVELLAARADENVDLALRALAEAGVPVPAELAAQFQQAAQVRLGSLARRAQEQLGTTEVLRGRGALMIALRSLSRVLDPHSGLVNPDDARRFDILDANHGLGLGVQDHQGVGPIIIKTVVPGSPAQRAGLRPGDRIVRIQGKPVSGDPTLGELLRPPVTTASELALVAPASSDPPAPPKEPGPFEVVIERAGDAPRRVVLEHAYYQGETVLGVQRGDNNAWDYWLDRPHGIAYARITVLGHTTPVELADLLDRLEHQQLRGLVLDLRWCPGGYFSESLQVAQLLLPRKQVVASVPARGAPAEVYAAAAARPHVGFPLLLLVNGETSGGAELIAAAIQDNHRGRVAGRRTVGKGSIQRTVSVVGDIELKLTSGTILRPSGKDLHRLPGSKPADDWGVRPDVELRESEEVERRVREWHALYALRPGNSRDILPLDDPANDPQRQSALHLLLKALEQTARN